MGFRSFNPVKIRLQIIYSFFFELSVYEKKICLSHFGRLSFALAASKIKEKARIVAMDLRGHGKSSSENDLDLSIEV